VYKSTLHCIPLDLKAQCKINFVVPFCGVNLSVLIFHELLYVIFVGISLLVDLENFFKKYVNCYVNCTCSSLWVMIVENRPLEAVTYHCILCHYSYLFIFHEQQQVFFIELDLLHILAQVVCPVICICMVF
jgi:hypothetical protein